MPDRKRTPENSLRELLLSYHMGSGDRNPDCQTSVASLPTEPSFLTYSSIYQNPLQLNVRRRG